MGGGSTLDKDGQTKSSRLAQETGDVSLTVVQHGVAQTVRHFANGHVHQRGQYVVDGGRLSLAQEFRMNSSPIKRHLNQSNHTLKRCA